MSDTRYPRVATFKTAEAFGRHLAAAGIPLQFDAELAPAELKGERHCVTPSGKGIGGEWRPGAGGGYLLWPTDLRLPAK